MLKPGTDQEEGIFSGSDWRNFILPGGTRLALGLEDEKQPIRFICQL